MRACPATLIIVILLLGTSPRSPADGEPDLSALVEGSWLCESGCWDEEVQFAIEDGVRVYNSWLHERPSASDGRWSLDGGRLHIECCAGMTFDYDVMGVTATALQLRDRESGEETLLRRIGTNAPDSAAP